MGPEQQRTSKEETNHRSEHAQNAVMEVGMFAAAAGGN